MAKTIMAHDWIYLVNRPGIWNESAPSPRQEKIRRAVREELRRLTSHEKEFVQLFWFEGRSFGEIEELLGSKPHKLEYLNKCILRKLRVRLAAFVREEFGIENGTLEDCQICRHPRRNSIDRILLAKKPQDTFRKTIRLLRNDYGLDLKTPQALIGHIKYHLKEE